MDTKRTSCFLYEVGHLKLVKRSGWWVAGIKDPESVAEHCFRTAITGYTLAHIAEADVSRVQGMCVFHDVHEVRIYDLNLLAKKYVSVTAPEAIVTEQVAGLPETLRAGILSFVQEFNAGTSREARLARDADRLECLLQAREYVAAGFPRAEEWVHTAFDRLQTEEARQIAESCLAGDPGSWSRVAPNS